MNYVAKPVNYLRIKLFLAAIFSTFCFLGMQGAASAQATDVPPTPNYNLPRPLNFDQGSDVHLLVARYSSASGYLLHSPESVVRIYTPDPTGSIQITSGQNCAPSFGDAGNVTNTFRMLALRPVNNNYFFDNTPYTTASPIAVSTIRNSGSFSCGNESMNWNIPVANRAAFRSTIPPFIAPDGRGLYALEFRASSSSGVGWNMFQLSLGNNGVGRLSFFAGSGHEFALKAQAGSGRGDFRMGFAPGCGLNLNERRTVELEWFDADAGESNQGTNPVRTRVVEYDNNGVRTNRNTDGFTNGQRIVDISSGNDLPGDPPHRRNLVVRGQYKYMWVWDNINDANGIQFQMPFDSYNNLLDFNDCPRAACADLSVTGSSAPVNPDGTYPVGTTVTVAVTVRNNGGSPWRTNYGLRQLTTPATSPQTINTGVSVPPGDPHTFNGFTLVRNTAGPMSATYRMVNGAGEIFGPNPLLAPCRITITWGAAAPGTVGLDVRCEDIEITGASSGSDVPARLTFTRTSGVGGPSPFNYDFTINTSTFVINDTFIAVNQLLPHNTYNVELFTDTGTGYQSVATTTLTRCMEADCTADVGGDPEPGEFIDVSYGAVLTNTTTKQFVDTYSVTVTASPAGSVTPGSWIISETMESGVTSLIGPQNVRINYESTLTANLFYDDTNNLSGIFTEFPCSDTITPRTRPYIAINYGDVSTGGAFLSGGACSVGVGPVPGNPYPGGIRAFANPDEQRGSGVDFAAFALGLIDGNSSGPYGFYSSAANGGAENALSFANYDPVDVGQLGGLLGGINPSASHCSPDYYADRPTTPFGGASTINLSSLSGDTRRFYDAGAGTVNISGTIPDARIAIYVNGDVHINGPINYPAPPWNIDSLPYLAIIVSGNITVDRNVGEINGLFIAQPRDATTGGVFSTCQLNSNLTISAAQITSQCRNTDFTLNGAVIAKEVRLLRADHTMFNSSGAAEIFNFVPSMVLGIPNFTNEDNTFDSLLSLPPVF